MSAENDLGVPSHATLHDALGLRWIERTPERCVAELPFSPMVQQATGVFHGGAVITLADTAATGLALSIVFPDGRFDPARFPLTLQLSANLIRNTDRGILRAEAVPLHVGRSTIVADVKVMMEDGRLAATVIATLLRPSGGTD